MSESAPPSHRCPTCKATSVNARNLAVFIDGTSCKPGPWESNVVKLYNAVSDEEGAELKQYKYYLEGIGADDVDNLSLPGRVGKEIYRSCEMAFAWNVDKNVKHAYSWLAKTYQEGDQIYLFGFSRGAYQVRALAAMIHEVGLLREMSQERVEQAYRRYLSIDPNEPQTRYLAVQFKKDFCWPYVRIHFVGAWHTVSSLGLTKRDVHITASASVTNACYFRHALALDERRVKFMPEYFTEVNTHRSIVGSGVGDVKEVWFAGCHGDVGGISRPDAEGFPNAMDYEDYTVHAGKIPLSWMRQEAADKGLVFKSEEILWCPDLDIDLGRADSMNLFWRYFELLPIRHQVSFSGTGKHAQRWHLFRPSLVIPGQQIHSSVLASDLYAPRAALAGHIDIPTVAQRASLDGLWTTEFLDEEATTRLLTLLLGDQQKTLKSLWKVLSLLDFRLDNGQTQNIPSSQWSEISVREQSSLNKFALTVIYDVTTDFSTSEELVRDARDSLNTILPFPDHLDFPRALSVLRFSAKHEALRRRFIAHDEVIKALMLALERVSKSRSENLFPSVMDSLRYLIDADGQRDDVVNQLTTRLDGTETGQTRLSLALEVKVPRHLTASLRMMTSLFQYQPYVCKELKPRIFKLAVKERGPVGSAAVEALVALNVPLTHDVPFSNVLGYLANTLPLSNAEVGSTSSTNNCGILPRVLQVNGSGGLDEQIVHKLVRTIESRDARQRTLATLTLLKLCRNSIIRKFCSQNKVSDIFVKQLERRETSLLAAYALKTCLEYDMWTLDHSRTAQLILAMLDNGWFDDAVGRVEGFEVFGELMTFDTLRQKALDLGIVGALMKKIEGGEPHEVRMSLIYLDILEREAPVELTSIVTQCLANLRNKGKRTQNKGVNILSALARTVVGEQAIIPHVNEIVKMLLPPPDGSPLSRSQLFGPTAALHQLCKNEILREQIENSQEYARLQQLRREGTLFPKT